MDLKVIYKKIKILTGRQIKSNNRIVFLLESVQVTCGLKTFNLTWGDSSTLMKIGDGQLNSLSVIIPIYRYSPWCGSILAEKNKLSGWEIMSVITHYSYLNNALVDN